MKLNRLILPLAWCAVLLSPSCTEEPRNTEPLTDPWLRERTPVNIRLEGQIGAASISDDWRDDSVGTVAVSLITTGLDITKVKVMAVDFKYPDSEFCPKASIAPGGTVDLSTGTTNFVVTAYNGETRNYTLTYSRFKDPLEGSYSFTPINGLLDPSNAPKSGFVIVGGWDGEVVRSTLMDKWWHWDTDYMPTDEDDNTMSFRLETADATTGETYGTLVNTPGPDGKYANYLYEGKTDMNGKYRIIPEGKSRWHKNNDNYFFLHSWEDSNYETPLYIVYLIGAGEQSVDGVSMTVPSMAFARAHAGPFNVIDWNYPDTRWFTDNVRYTVWLVKKDSDSPLDNHSSYLN
ncbi:MAG: hypothetical protein J6X57_00120 [Bacteroidales bacterium]|nr:hypothetical protein [Bacteroidales bacterium]